MPCNILHLFNSKLLTPSVWDHAAISSSLNGRSLDIPRYHLAITGIRGWERWCWALQPRPDHPAKKFLVMQVSLLERPTEQSLLSWQVSCKLADVLELWSLMTLIFAHVDIVFWFERHFVVMAKCLNSFFSTVAFRPATFKSAEWKGSG